MKVVITGGGGFLGDQLCRKLLQRGELTGVSNQIEPITEILLFDTQFRSPPIDATLQTNASIKVVSYVGRVDNRDEVFSILGEDPNCSIFHLASMVSGECEERFDDAMQVNLDGGRNIFEAARKLPSTPRVVFASSIACFGGDNMPSVCSDQTKLMPQTTYGMTKVICELLINDYSRKGFLDGRSARLPTVIIRPGKPNAAASSWASGMFREPLQGQPCLLPVRRDQPHPMTSYRTVIDSLIAIHELPASRFGTDRAIGLPANRITPALAEKALNEVASEQGITLGEIVDSPDRRIQSIVDNWPIEIDGSRALRLGLPNSPSLQEIIRDYIEDFGAGIR